MNSIPILGVRSKPPSCGRCSYSYVGKGFCPDHAPANPKLAVILEGPGKDEILGQSPMIGASGQFWLHTLIEPFGFKREDILIGNTIRCNPPSNVYPTGKLRRDAEECCRQYDDKISNYNPNIFIITFHPAAILRVSAYYKLTLRAMEQAFKFASMGYRPCVLMGDKAAHLIFPQLEGSGGVSAWHRHWFEGRWK